MNQFFFPAFQNGIAVFVGLFALWTLVKFTTWQQRLLYAAIAGAVSALAHFVIAGLVSGTI